MTFDTSVKLSARLFVCTLINRKPQVESTTSINSTSLYYNIIKGLAYIARSFVLKVSLK